MVLLTLQPGRFTKADKTSKTWKWFLRGNQKLQTLAGKSREEEDDDETRGKKMKEKMKKKMGRDRDLLKFLCKKIFAGGLKKMRSIKYLDGYQRKKQMT